MMLTLAQRAAVVAEALTWVGTPYHHYGRVKGVGVDCATLLACVYENSGVSGPIDIPAYSPQWHINRVEEKYTDFIRQFADEISGDPQPGDIVVWRFHNTYSHGGIVVSWPKIVHAFVNIGCFVDDALANEQLCTVTERTALSGQPRPLKYFSMRS